jgi:hypothetical protein
MTNAQLRKRLWNDRIYGPYFRRIKSKKSIAALCKEARAAMKAQGIK